MSNKPLDEPLPENTRILKNGAVYDNDRKRIVAMRPDLAEKNTQITSQTAGVMQAIAQERKRDVVKAAANKAVERADYRIDYGDLAFVAAIAETAYIKATTPDDPKAIDAARFLLKESGYSEEVAQAQEIAQAQKQSPIMLILAQLQRRDDVIDADVIPMRSELEDSESG